MLVGELLLKLTDWCGKMSTEQPQFIYWSVVLEMELCIFQNIESIRTGNFLSYRESLAMFIPRVFSFDHMNYDRWLSAHIRDMYSLSEKHPAIYQEFIAGRFVAHKTNRSFSAMALDQAHEQANPNVKGDGGAVGLTKNPMRYNSGWLHAPKYQEWWQSLKMEPFIVQLNTMNKLQLFKPHWPRKWGLLLRSLKKLEILSMRTVVPAYTGHKAHYGLWGT